MKRRIYITLIGGLGNQLFQYACGFNLAHNLDAKLIIDDRGGFYFDKKFQRYNLLPKNLSYVKANMLEVILLFVLRILKKILFSKKIFLSLNNFVFIDETKEKKYISNFFDMTKNKKVVYLIGFFQSEKYFLNTKKLILKKIIQNQIQCKKLNQLQKVVNNKSLMIGIRKFEEAPKFDRKKFGGTESFNFYNKNYKIFKKRFNIKHSFIFSTLKNQNIFDELKIKDISIINKENSFDGTDLDYLIFFSLFNNFLISNSTFYYWGALISEYKFKKINIICSKKFTNKDTNLKRWDKIYK
tara:strand:- start:293 stop:1186 length:894 start_codon:yes stop_codon:yes gene_type:complete